MEVVAPCPFMRQLSVRLIAVTLLALASACTSSDGGTAASPESEAATTTTTAETTTTTTTTAAPRLVTITETPVEIGLDPDPIRKANNLDLLDPNTALIVGDMAAARGTAPNATVWTTSDGRRFAETPLEQDRESTANAAAIDGANVAVVGVVREGDVNRSVVWRSADGGTSFADAEYVGDGPGLGATAVFFDGELIVVSWAVAEDGRKLVAVKPDQVGNNPVDLPSPGRNPWVSGAAVVDSTVVISGSVEVDGATRGALWTSSDAGDSFTFVDDASVAESLRIGAPQVGVDGLVAMASRPDNGESVLLTTANGQNWREIPLALEGQGANRTAVNAGARPIVPFGDFFAVGFVDQISGVAIVDGAGSGTFGFAPYNSTQYFFSPRPIVLDDTLFVMASTPTGFRFSERSIRGAWTTRGGPSDTAEGPDANALTFIDTSEGLVLAATSWPEVSGQPGGAITWRGITDYVVDDNGWVTTSEIPESRLVVSDGSTDLSIDYVEDPADDDLPGPRSGTAVQLRVAGDAWGEAEIVLSGPGGDYLFDAVGVDGGFVAVGGQRVRSATGENTKNVVVMELVDGEWRQIELGLDLGDRAELFTVAASADGDVLATGEIFRDGAFGPLLIRRPAGGSWEQVELLTTDPDVEIREVIETDAGLEVITNELASWYRYTPAEDGTYQRTAIRLPSPGFDFLSSVVALDDRLVVIGTHWEVGFGRLALWELTDEGTAVALEIDRTITSTDLSLNDAVVADGTLMVGGVRDHQHLVWTVDLGDQ